MESLKQQSVVFSNLDLPAIREKVGAASVDVFGQEQLYALRNQLNYHPCPVFQTYMGYNSGLDYLNERFYLSAAAPDYVIFQLTPVDHKFAPMEDSFVMRDLLLNYKLSFEESPCLLLKRKSTDPPRMRLLKQATGRMNERIDLTGFGETNLWMEIGVRPSVRGHLRSLLSRPAVMRIAAWSGNKKAAYKAPEPMLAAGFVATPLLLDTDDVRNFYQGKVKRPDAYSLQTDPGGQVFWEQTFDYRIYAFE